MVGFVLGVGICNWRIQVQDALDGSCLRVSGGVVVWDMGQQKAKQSKAVPIWRSLREL